jgi:WD40 repeat protein
LNSPSFPVPKNCDPKQAHPLTQWSAGRPFVCCRFDASGHYLFCGLESPTIERIQLSDGKKLAFPGGHDSWVFSLASSAEGSTMYSGGGDGRVVFWETTATTPKPSRTIDAHQGWIRAMAMSADGSVLATGGNDRMVRLWNPSTGSLLHECKAHQGHVYSVESHPGGRTILSGDLQGQVHEWDIKTGKLVGTFDATPLHTYDGSQRVDFGGVRGLAVSHDGKFVAAGGLHKATNPLGAVHEPVVIIFDAQTRKPVRTLLVDGIAGGIIWRLRYLSDGSLMGISGGNSGGFLLFWKAGSDKDYHRLGPTNMARDMDLHADGLRVATAHHDGYARLTRLAAGTV